MGTWMKTGIIFMQNYKDGAILILLALLFILMLILLKSVRKTGKNLRNWNRKIARMEKMMTQKLQMQEEKTDGEPAERESEICRADESSEEYTEGNIQKYAEKEDRENLQEEELFGQVLQEYFP